MPTFTRKCLNAMRLFNLVSFLFIFMACGSKISSVESLKNEVMSIHDESMKYKSDIMKAIRSLSNPQIVKSLDSSDVQNAIAELNLADSLMMDWMHNYKEPADPMLLEDYLKGELITIKKVEHVTNSAMAQAKKLLPQ